MQCTAANRRAPTSLDIIFEQRFIHKPIPGTRFEGGGEQREGEGGERGTTGERGEGERGIEGESLSLIHI